MNKVDSPLPLRERSYIIYIKIKIYIKVYIKYNNIELYKNIYNIYKIKLTNNLYFIFKKYFLNYIGQEWLEGKVESTFPLEG